jgi:hypothetical protein
VVCVSIERQRTSSAFMTSGRRGDVTSSVRDSRMERRNRRAWENRRGGLYRDRHKTSVSDCFVARAWEEKQCIHEAGQVMMRVLDQGWWQRK